MGFSARKGPWIIPEGTQWVFALTIYQFLLRKGLIASTLSMAGLILNRQNGAEGSKGALSATQFRGFKGQSPVGIQGVTTRKLKYKRYCRH